MDTPKPVYHVRCPLCRGTGDLKCHTCYGGGKVSASDWDVDFGHWRYRNIPCPECNGRGKRLCPDCLGDGTVESETPPPAGLPPPLDTETFNRRKREKDLAAKRAQIGDTKEKLDTLHGHTLKTVCTGRPSELSASWMDEDEREWLDDIRRGSRMKGCDPDDA